MSVTFLPSRAAARALQVKTVVRTRYFSTPVNDTFSPVPSTPPPPPATQSALWAAVNARAPRNDWSKDEIRDIYNTPLMELAHQAVGECSSTGIDRLV